MHPLPLRALLLKCGLLWERGPVEAYEAEVVLVVKGLEDLLHVFVGLLVVEDATILRVDNEAYAAPQHVVVAQVLIDGLIVL